MCKITDKLHSLERQLAVEEDPDIQQEIRDTIITTAFDAALYKMDELSDSMGVLGEMIEKSVIETGTKENAR